MYPGIRGRVWSKAENGKGIRYRSNDDLLVDIRVHILRGVSSIFIFIL